ncbi:tetratricopeptide repeat-containing protein [Frigidibacter sp.]|uniref:tetratricopeptide repeat-containing protein n=1 Tax=Frigidibacter sp. TaxID=2586418 RepID=UPI0027372AE6|nr:tetratricopeptide repeat-containing protein [Frigidibacter sp.]MDP3340782.1 hypothetical protein [Frigidibacter sp.]
MTVDERPICFIVMGFGKKTDYELGMTFDLDATYRAIIEPAVKSAGLRPIRADEILHSAVIDFKMYDMLLRADVVVADISTGNANALYELGVRHALRPNTTVVMKEDRGRLHFDLNHINTFHYRHLGEDIGFTEANRAREALSALLVAARESQEPDSPVYTFLPRLQRPRLSEEEYQEIIEQAEEAQERMSDYLERGESAFESSEMDVAVAAYSGANKLKPGEPYIVQRLALATYKCEIPSKLEALMKARELISELDPDNSNDPETLGLAGAIRKRLWIETGDLVQLNYAIKYYGRGFDVRRDYYNGQNLADCYISRSSLQSDVAEVQYDSMSATKVWSAVIQIIEELMKEPDFDERADRQWILATMAHCLKAVGRTRDGDEYERMYRDAGAPDWEVKSFDDGLRLIEEL